jgi:hypothetical protein
MLDFFGEMFYNRSFVSAGAKWLDALRLEPADRTAPAVTCDGNVMAA